MLEDRRDAQAGPGLDRDGFSMVANVLGEEERIELLTALGPATAAGRRGILSAPAVATLAQTDRVLDFIRPHLPAKPFPVRAIYFEKSPETNWLVPWHQDLTLTVRFRVDSPGFGPWSVKDGIPHDQPPVEVLEEMLTVRLHLDDADESNGALRVVPGSHRFGRLTPARIRELCTKGGEHLCAVPAGGALLMRPLLLHASSRSTSARPRRVVHIEYAARNLPNGLEWYDFVSGR